MEFLMVLCLWRLKMDERVLEVCYGGCEQGGIEVRWIGRRGWNEV